MQQPPDTSLYFYAGQVVILGGIVLYILSLWWRARGLEADRQALQEWEQAEG